MEYLKIKEAMKQGTGEVSIRGWVYRERKSAKVAFVVVRDSTDIIQCVVKKDAVSEDVWITADKTAIE